MNLSRKTRLTIHLVMVSISLFVWVLLLVNPGNIKTIANCHALFSVPPSSSFQVFLALNPFSAQLMGWGLMVVAMMLPKLITPIQFIYVQSFKNYRFWYALLFVMGYLCTWMIAGVFMVTVIMGAHFLFPQSHIPAIVVICMAAIWEFSPMKQQFLNLGHNHRVLAAFGWKANWDALFFGITHGLWCIGSGWALMLFPMILLEGHNVAMLVVTLIMISEHMEHPRLPKWRFHFRLKLVRILVAQTRIKVFNK